MEKKSVKKNYLYNLMYQIVIIILPVVLTPYLSRVLGSNGIGIYGYTLSIVTYFILIGTLGMNLYGQREIAIFQNDEKNKSKVFTELLTLRIITVFIVILLFFLIFCLNGEYAIYYRILLLELFSNMIDISWLFQGLEEFKKIVFRNLIIKFITIVSVFIFVNDVNDLWIYIFIYCFSNFLGNLLLWYRFQNYAKLLPLKDVNIFRHIKPILLLFIPQISIQVYAVLDKTMIGLILKSMSEVGFYEQSQKIIRILMTVMTSLGIVMLPRISHYYSEQKIGEVKKYIRKSFELIFFLAFPMMFGIIAVSNSFVPAFFGSGYEKVVYLMSIMSLIIVPVGISNITGNMVLIPQKRQKEYSISVIVGALVNFLLNYILIRILGTIGAVISTVIAETLISIIQLKYCKNEISVSEVLNISRKYFISSVIMFILCLIPMHMNMGTILTIFLQISIGIVTYVLMLYILKDDFFINSFRTIKSSLKRRNTKHEV